MKGWRFLKPDWRITTATVLACGLFIIAGNWQSGKATTKEAMQARLDAHAHDLILLQAEPVKAEDYALRRLAASGVYEAKYSILVDNKVYRGKAGYHVYSPLRIAGSDMHVLVNRGWVAQGRTREELPQVVAPAGMQNVAGIAVAPSGQFLELRAEEKIGPLWQNLDLERYKQWSGLRLQPIVIEQVNDAGDGLVRDWPRPDLGIEKHRVYALQWYSFLALAIALYIFFHVKRKS